MQIPSYPAPCFQKVCLEVKGPRPQQVPRTPELPCFLQQPLLALEQAPANHSPAAMQSQLLVLSRTSSALQGISARPQSLVCVAAHCSCTASGFNWPAVAPTAQDAPGPGDYANYDITSKEAGYGLCHLIFHVPRAEMSTLKTRKTLTACVIC